MRARSIAHYFLGITGSIPTIVLVMCNARVVDDFDASDATTDSGHTDVPKTENALDADGGPNCEELDGHTWCNAKTGLVDAPDEFIFTLCCGPGSCCVWVAEGYFTCCN